MATKKTATTTKTAARSAPARAPASKAGAATSPQDTAGEITGTHRITAGNRVSIGGRFRTHPHQVNAADFASKRDPDGSKTLQRLLDGGELEATGGKGKTGDDAERAGGGLLEAGGAAGAGPSGAQILAAETGEDPGATAVVAAALIGSKADFTAAAEADSTPPGSDD
jgi:hypothetical protein